MSNKWQAKILMGELVDQPKVVYGESLEHLKESAAIWLMQNQPLAFGNASPNHDLSRRFNYSYSDGTKIPVFSRQTKPLEEGWYGVSGESRYSTPQRFETFEKVVLHFIEQAIIPEKGPDYNEVALVEGNLQLHLIKTIKRESEELQVNDMLQRGWYIIAVEYKGRTIDYSEQLVDRKASFVLGHPEEYAV
jgi:hypothetical protein